MSGETHTLRTQILTDFGESASNIEEFAGEIATLNTSMSELGNSTKQSSEALSKFHLKIGEKLKEAVKDMSEGIISFEGKNIKSSIEKSLDTAVSNRDIVFKNLNDADSFEVTFDPKKIEKLKEKIIAYLNKVVTKATLPRTIGDDVTLTLNSNQLKSLKQNFAAELSKTLEEGNIQFDIDGKKLAQFKVSADQLNLVVSAIQKKFNDILANPDFIKTDSANIKPITWSSTELEKALVKIQESIGNVDEHLGGIDTKALNELPPIKDKLKDFRTYVVQLITKVNEVLFGIDNLKPDDQTHQYKQLGFAIEQMQRTILDKTKNIIDDVSSVVRDKGLPSQDYGTILGVMLGVQDQINGYLMRVMNHANKEIENAMNIQTKDINGVKVKAPSIKKLQQQILKASQEALKNLDVGDLSIDVSKTRALFDVWAKETMHKLDTAWLTELLPLQTDLLSSSSNVYKKFADNVKNLTKIKLFGDEENPTPIEVEIDTKQMRKDIESEMKKIAQSLVKGVSFSEAGERALEGGIKLPKTVADNLNKTVRDMLVDQTNKLAEQVQKRQGLDFTEAHLEKFDNELFKNATSMINSIVKQAQDISKTLADGVEGAGFKNFSNDEQQKIRETFSQAGTKMVTDYTSMMDNALGAFVIAGSVSEEMNKKIQQSLNNILKSKDIQFEDKDTPLVLDSLVKRAQGKLQQLIDDNIKGFEPYVDGSFQLDVNWKDITNPLQEAIQDLFKTVANQLKAQLSSLVDTIPSVKQSSEDKRVLFHGTSNKNYEGLKEKGFEFVTDLEDPRRMYSDNLFGNKAVYMSDDITSDWYKGSASRMPEYDKLLAVEAKFKKLMTIRNDDDLRKAIGQYGDGLDKALVTVDSIGILMEKFTENIRKAGYDGLEINYDPRHDKEVNRILDSVPKPGPDDDIFGEVSQKGIEAYEKAKLYLEDNKVAMVSELQRQIASLDPSNLKILGEADRTKSNKQNLSQYQTKDGSDFNISSKDLHKDVRKYLADQNNQTVKEWEKNFPGFSGGEGLGEVMKANIAVIMHKFHQAIANHTGLAVNLYKNEIGNVPFNPNTEAVNFLAIKLDQLSTDINKKIQDAISQQFKGLGDAIKGIKLRPLSVSFDEGDVNEAMSQFIKSNLKNASAHTGGTNNSTSQQGKPTSLAHSDPFSKTGRSGDYESYLLEDDLYVRGARISALNARNRFDNKLDAEQKTNLDNFLNNQYLPEVMRIADEWKVTDPKERGQLRADKTFIAQELKWIIELIRKELGEGKADDEQDKFSHNIDRLSDKMQHLVDKGDLPTMQFKQFQDMLENASTPFDLTRAKEYYADMVKQQRTIDTDRRKSDSFDILKEKLDRDVTRFVAKDKGNLLDGNKVDTLRQSISSLENAPKKIDEVKNAIQDLKDEYKRLDELEKKRAKDEKAEKRKGDLLLQNDLLKTQATLQSEVLQTVLKLVPALQGYQVEQMRVNNATDTWSARLRDAEGNVRSLTGSLDKATGELFQHSEALSLVNRKANNLEYGGGKPTGYSSFNRNNVFDRYNQRPDYDAEARKHNPNGDFGTSVVNTMRYITAGALIGGPSMAFYEAWDSAKEFDYQMERARQNFLIKGDLDPSKQMQDVAIQRLTDLNGGRPIDVNDPKVQSEIKAMQEELKNLSSGSEIRRKVQDIAIAYGIDTQEAAKAFHIGSRSVDDPNEALAIAQAVARGNSIEEVDTEVGAKGLEAIMNTYGIRGYASNDIMDMMIMAAQFSPAKLEDYLAMQQRAGAVFAENLPGMSKREQLSTSIGLTGIFSQSTARSGAEAGTFFKAFLPRFFTGPGLEALEETSKFKGFEKLNPYNADGSKKDFTTILSAFLEKSMHLTDKDRADLWKRIVPGWHSSSAEALDNFLDGLSEDLENQVGKLEKATGEKAGDTDGNGQIDKSETLQWYFDRIKNVNPQQIAMLQEGTLGTWDKRTQRIKTMWQASTEGVMGEFKDEFADLAQYLTVYMRMIRENATETAHALELGAKFALGLGARFAFSQLSEKVAESDRAKKQEKFGKIDRYLGAEQQALGLRRMGIEAQMGGTSSVLADIARRRVDVTNQMNHPERLSRREQMVKDRDSFAETLQVMQQTHEPSKGIDNSSSIESHKQEIVKMDRAIQDLDDETQRYQHTLNQLQQEEDDVKRSTQLLTDELQQNDREMQSVNNRVRMLETAYKDLGIDSSTLKTKVQDLNNEFSTGTIDAQRYDKEIRVLARESGISDNQLSKLRTEVDRVNQEFREGTIDAKAYITQIERLERAHLTGVAGVQGGGLGMNPANQKGVGLMEAIMAGSMFAPLMVGKRGVMQRMKDFKTTKSLKDLLGKGKVAKNELGEDLRDVNGNLLFERDIIRNKKINTPGMPGKLSGVLEEGGKLSKFAKFGRMAKGPLKAVPYLGEALLAFEALNWGMDAMTAKSMKGYEKNLTHAGNLDQMARDVQGNDNYSWKNPMKVLGGITTLSDMAFQGVNSWLGGNGVSFGDSKKMLIASWKKEGSELNKELQEGIAVTKDGKGIAENLRNSELAAQKAMNPDEPIDPEGDSLDEQAKIQQAQLEQLEKLNEAVGKIEGSLDRERSINQADYTIESTKLLLQGVDQDSQQMRDLMNDMLLKNMTAINTALGELSKQKDTITDKSSDEYKDLEAREKVLRSEKSQTELQIKQNSMSEYDEIMNNLADELKKSDTEYGIQKDNAQLGGAAQDSGSIKNIESQRVSKSNALIENAQKNLEQLIKDTNAQGSDLTKIQQAILDLEKDQKDNLIAIKENLEKNKTTFNLPSDVNPVSYMDYVTRNQTHKNMTARAGDVTINLNIDNMNGSQSDVNKVASSLTEAIKKANQQMAREFNNQVISGLGRSY